PDYVHREPAGKLDRIALDGAIRKRRIQGLARERCHQLQVAKSGAMRGFFACAHQSAADPSSSPGRMHEERADTGRLARRIELARPLRVRPFGTAEERFPLAPSTASDDDGFRLGHEIGAVVDQALVDGEYRAQ